MADDVSAEQIEQLVRRRFPNWSEERVQAKVREEVERAGGKETGTVRATAGSSYLKARRRMDEAEWAIDCLKSRADAIERRRVADAARADAEDIKVSFDKQYRGAVISATRTVGGQKVFGFDDAFSAYRQEDGTYEVQRMQGGQVMKARLSEADAKAEMKRLLMNAPIAPPTPVMRPGYSELQGLFGVPKRRR